jgi:hypothetical protein
MAKKRKTREQKIILQLRRQLAKEKSQKTFREQDSEACQGVVKNKPKILVQEKPIVKNTYSKAFSFDYSLVKKDLLKTFVLSLIIVSLELVLYLKLR